MRLRLLVVSTVVALTGLPIGMPHAATLIGPFDAISANRPVASAYCRRPHAPIDRFFPPSIYDDRALWQHEVEPVYAFRDELNQASDRFLRGLANADCTLAMLAKWAEADALKCPSLSRGAGFLPAHQEAFERTRVSSQMALAYLKVRGGGVGRKLAIENWLARLGQCAKDYATFRLSSATGINNHHAWASLAIMSTAIAADDQALFGDAVRLARRVLATIHSDGSIDAEVRRGPRSLFYHNYTLLPLVQSAELALLNGVDLYRENGGALHALAANVTKGLNRNEPLKPSWSDNRRALLAVLAWVPLYYRRTSYSALRQYLDSDFFGGSKTYWNSALWSESGGLTVYWAAAG